MHRRELLNRACGMGMCSCVASVMFEDLCNGAQNDSFGKGKGKMDAARSVVYFKSV
jgi:hypothetical protein